VEVTKKGLAVIDKVSEVMDAVEAQMLEGFEPGEREQLAALLAGVWERRGGYEAYSRAAAGVDEHAA
jgi:hypothetical protein